MEWLYSFDELRAYRLDTKQGKERLETLLKQLPNILDAAGIKLSAKPRVLCLMAGSCIEGMAFAQLCDADVTCLDLQRTLLSIGEKEAKRRKLSLQTVTSDIRELAKHVKGKFDLITILGSPLPHINIYDFDTVIGRSRRFCRKPEPSS